MPKNALCPGVDELRHFLLGMVPNPQAAALDEHLSRCPHCATEAERLQTRCSCRHRARLEHCRPQPSRTLPTQAGRHGQPVIDVFSGRTGRVLRQFNPFPPGMQGALHLSMADVGGDDVLDLVVSDPSSGQIETVIFDGTTLLAPLPRVLS
jgi:hypothetical protein